MRVLWHLKIVISITKCTQHTLCNSALSYMTVHQILSHNIMRQMTSFSCMLQVRWPTTNSCVVGCPSERQSPRQPVARSSEDCSGTSTRKPSNEHPIQSHYYSRMMTSSNENIFRVTGHLCGEFNGHWWIPRTKASDAELWCFLWYAPKYTVEWTITRLVIWDTIAPIMTSV